MKSILISLVGIVLTGANLSFADVRSSRLDSDKLFGRGDYQQALQLYQKANQSSQNDWTLKYNMAVCYFKLQHWRQARDAFSVLNKQEPDNSLIAYNLAVTEKKLGNTDLAKAMFYNIAQSADDESLKLLATRQYHKLRGNYKSAAHSPSGWIGSIDLSYGQDDNVVDTSTSESTEDNDYFYESLVTARWYQDTLHKSDSWYVEGTGLFSRYQDVSDYDTDVIILGGGKSTPTTFGRWLLGLRLEALQLGGEDYLRTTSLHGGFEGDFDKFHGWSVNYRVQNITSQQSDYDYLDGDAYRIDLAYVGRLDNGLRWKLRYRYDNEEREDLLSDNDFYSYSANRHGLMLQGIYIVDKWMLVAKAEHRISDYKDDHQLSGEVEQRQDNRDQVSLRLERRLGSNWIVSADYSYTDNQSSLSQYDYDRGVFMLGAGLQF